MTKNLLVAFLICFCYKTGYSQLQNPNKKITVKNGVSKPSVLSTHPFGIFFSRIQGNFKTQPPLKTNLQINLESGNVWGTEIKTYIPNSKAIKDQVRAHKWDQAMYFFEEEELDAKSFELQIDGVIKGLRLNTSFKLGSQHELNIGLRLFALTKGKLPFSLFTGDDFIENFHKKIAGGDDPFDRDVFGRNKAFIKYIDRNGNSMTLNKNDIVFGGIETSYYYYLKNLSSNTFYVNFGTHFGLNLSNYNSSLDIGLSINTLKKILIKPYNYFQIGIEIGALRKSLLNFQNNNLDLGTKDYIGNLESVIEYNFVSEKKITHSIGIDYYMQTSLNKKDELQYIIPIRHPNAHKAWGHGVTNLYKNNSYWTLFYSFTKKVTTSFYLQQDLEVNNNPDIQTGVHILFYLN